MNTIIHLLVIVSLVIILLLWVTITLRLMRKNLYALSTDEDTEAQEENWLDHNHTVSWHILGT